MKLNKYFMLGLAGLAFAACSNDDEIGKNLPDDNIPKTLVVSIAGISNNVATKANAPQWSKDETNKGVDNITKLALFFTDGAGVVKYGYQVSSTDTDDKATVWTALKDATKGVKFVALQGVDAVHVVANVAITDTDIEEMIENETNVSTLNATFKAQSVIDAKTGVFYAGSDLNIMEGISTTDTTTPTVDLVGTEDKPATAATITYTAEVKLYPVLSRIQINKITMKTAGSVNFPAAAVGTITANAYKLAWSGFKPTLHGIYLNNFADNVNYFSASVASADMRKNTTALNTITAGKWLFDTTDYADDTSATGGGRGAYVSYTTGGTPAYGELLGYPAASTENNQDLVIDDAATTQVKECIAFNILIPYNFAAGTPVEVANPSIHFQFSAPVAKSDDAPNGYEVTYSKNGANPALTDEDKNNISHCTEYISYTMPGNGVNGFLYANISKLVTANGGTTEIDLVPGKIYNMEVVIDPANMIVDIVPPTSYNVVVKIMVEDFEEVNIFPGLDKN